MILYLEFSPEVFFFSPNPTPTPTLTPTVIIAIVANIISAIIGDRPHRRRGRDMVVLVESGVFGLATTSGGELL